MAVLLQPSTACCAQPSKMTLARLLTFPSIQHVPRQTWEEGLLGGTGDRARGECTDIRGGRKQCLPDLAGQAQSNLSVLERQTGMGAGDSARTGRGEGGVAKGYRSGAMGARGGTDPAFSLPLGPGHPGKVSPLGFLLKSGVRS